MATRSSVGRTLEQRDEGGKCCQTREGVKYATMHPAKYLSQKFDAIQMPVPFSYGNIISYLRLTLRLRQIRFVCFLSFFLLDVRFIALIL